MSGTEVATVVASIISAFGNGMEVYRRMVGKKSKRRGREPTLSEEEAWLQDSLEKRPLEIRSSYDRRVASLGHRFEIGDSAAHSSLAHTLLILNTGLINLINHALSRDSKTRDVSRRSLLNLSEEAAVDTLRALSQLSLRLSQHPQLTHQSVRPQKDVVKYEQDVKPTKRGGQSKKRPAPSPLLVRGGWVRSKSGSSVVSVVPATKSPKGTGGKHQRSKSEPALAKASKSSHSRSRASLSAEAPQAGLPSCSCQTPDTHATRRHHHVDDHRPQRQPSMMIVPSDFFEDHPQDKTGAPLRPPKVPLHSRPNTTSRQRPLSSATFMTASTKFGEIPERRWPDRAPSPEQERMGSLQPYVLPPMRAAEGEEPKSRGRGFKFWKREEKRQPVAAY